MTKHKFIEDNMGLVYAVVQREFPSLFQDEDIIQSGMIGLCLAADRWDKSIGTFAGFAWSCIRNEILRELRRRAKHPLCLSLDYEYVGENGNKYTLGDTVAGDMDVVYIDYCEADLTPLQKKILELLKMGLESKEIAKILNTTVQNVSWTRRKIRILREQTERKG